MALTKAEGHAVPRWQELGKPSTSSLSVAWVCGGLFCGRSCMLTGHLQMTTSYHPEAPNEDSFAERWSCFPSG